MVDMNIFSAPSDDLGGLGQPDPNMLTDFTFDELRELPMSVQMGVDLTALD